MKFMGPLMWLISIAAIGYLLGSIPFGYLLVRIFHGEDIRQTGSGNIGATNVSRKSPALGVATLLLDALKGATAVLATYVLVQIFSASLICLVALCAVLGHMSPVWLKFRGGKGVATALGAFAVIAPEAVLAAACIFLLVAGISRHVSLGSIVAVAAFPFLAWLLHKPPIPPSALFFIVLTSLLIILKHHENIRRLMAGTENRIGAKPE